MTNWIEVILWSAFGVMVLAWVCACIFVYAVTMTRFHCAKLCDQAQARCERLAARYSGRERDLLLGGADEAGSLAEYIRSKRPFA